MKTRSAGFDAAFRRRCGLLLTLIAFTAPAPARAQSGAAVTIQAGQPGAVVSSNLFGIFFEEINFAGDGGLYAEMVRNRAFYNPTNALYWTLVKQGSAAGTMTVDATRPLNTNIPNSLKLTMLSGTGGVGAGNSGFWGMSLQAAATYNLNFFAAASAGFAGPVVAQLQNAAGSTVYAQASFGGLTTNWQRFSAPLVSAGTDTNARLVLALTNAGTVWLDVVSLFPAATFDGHTNGLRPDLANMLAALHPSFLRFPGGNFIEGANITNAVRWKKTIGDISQRPGHMNDAWGYWSTDGFGYHEFLQFCEDTGMQPLYGINCGLALGYNGDTNNTVPLSQIGPWVQDALDAIQYANGGTNTTWGALRAANGHPAPFNLQYMEIGNENGGTYYNDRYALFYNAIKSNYPAIHIIASDWGGIPAGAPVEIQDEHYYSSAGTFDSYATKYDSYNRNGPKVFVGEYAVNSGFGTNGNLASALGEAAFMTGMERNSDLVRMASYAPLFANVNGMQWQPDLIYYDSARAIFGTPSYYVQELFSQNRGDAVLPTAVVITTNLINGGPHGAIGVGSWNTSVQYTNIVVTSNGVVLYHSDFVNQGTNGWSVFNGSWSTNHGLYQQTAIITDCYSTYGNTNWANYTISLQARKVAGNEGFLVLFNFLDDNNWTWWNIGGWNNTLDGVEQTVGGNKSLISGQVPQNIATNTWYNISIVQNYSNILCYLNGSLIQTVPNPAGLYASSVWNKSSGQIIVKTVNSYNAPLTTTINVVGASSVAPDATLVQLTSASATDENSLSSPTHVFPVTNLIASAGTNFTVTLPANSLSILRLQPAGIISYTNLQLQLASPINTGQQAACTVLGQQSGNWIDLTANANHAVTYASADTNIAIVDSYGNVTGVGSGTTSIIAAYASLGLSATQSLQVVDAPTALVHRYSFNDGTANDSVGTANGTLMGNATVSGGRLVLPNATSAAPATDYLQLPPGILTNSVNGANNDPAVTVEAWATFNPGQYTWANLFDFGNRDGGGLAEYDIHLCVHANDDSTIAGISDSDNANADYQSVDLGSGTSLDGAANVHIVAIFNPPEGYEAVYLNGVLAGANYNVTIPMSGVQAVRNIIGADNWPDPGMQGSVDEFRIYNGALTPNQIAATDALGPDQLLDVAPPVMTVSPATNGVMLSWPVAAAGFSLQSTTNPVPGGWTNVTVPSQLVGSQWQVSVPASGSAQFFRLAQ